MKIKVYMVNNAIYEFPARNINNAREIAKRIIMEGLWTEEDEEQFYPITQIYKVKIVR